MEASAYLAPDRKHNVSIPRTFRQSKSARLALAATGAVAAVTVLVSGGAAAAGNGPAPAYRVAAVAAQRGPVADRIQPVGGPPPSQQASQPSQQASQPSQQASQPGQQASQPAAVAGQASVAGQATAAGQTPAAGRTPASQHQAAAQRKAADKLRLVFGDKLAGATRGAASHRSGQHAAHRGHSRPAQHRQASACADSTLHWWICHAEGVLERHGTSRSVLSTNAAYIVVEHESGGNPHAYNGWDSNAAQGHPSEGIAQVIGPTFHAYALRGYSDIWNPVDNMIAAFRYAISRYGSMNNIPGVVAVRQGGSYVGY